MKRFTLLSSLFLLAVNLAFAQKDADAKKILTSVSAKYKAYKAIKTDFSFTIDNLKEDNKQTRAGSLIARPGTNKFKVTIYTGVVKSNAAIEQEIISDGKTQWTYLKKDKEVQVNNAGSGTEGINPAQIFTIYEKGYKYVYTGDEKLHGKLCQVIELSPTDGNKSIFKARLFIDKEQKQIYSATLFDKAGARYTYTIKNFTGNATAPDAMFVFNTKVHPGVEVVDLR